MKLGSIEALYSIYTTHPSVVTDTRKLKAGDLYFALKGPNFNGNLFALAALDQKTFPLIYIYIYISTGC